ncbi:hypothetical protein H4Q32_017736 [Labeo rohita]|uniref:Ig-like domain-containing protein n=1 Tax=Labeo rohita TaxID=84645 RepID=A0ABQ8LXI8_LABRO|nr:CD4-1 molecule [Labeo rohita]KAI2655352.1 hypothetical protein H4Q32_017736 [Labeo rohita]
MMLCWILISLFVGFIKAQEVIYAQLGGTVTLPREKVEGNADSVYVNWFRGSDPNPAISKNPQSGIQKEKEIKTHAHLLDDFSLQISPVQDFDFVIWRCEQHELQKTSKKTYKLYHVTIPKVSAVMVGAFLSLQCNVDDSSVIPEVKWIAPKNSDCNPGKYDKVKETVTITNVDRCHSGVWTCKLKYGGKETKATTAVFVIDLSPPIPDTIYTSPLTSSSTVKIPCSLYSNIPWLDLNETGLRGGSWSFTPLSDPPSTHPLLNLNIGPVVRWDVVNGTDGIPTIEGRELKDQDLSIHNLRVSEKIRGNYTCSLKFKSKILSRTVKVEVLKILSSEGSRVYEGKSVNLTCTLGHQQTSDFKVKWNCSSCSFVSSLGPSHPFTLLIPELKVKDSGRWTCELWKGKNKLTSAVLSLKIEKPPVNIWLIVAICGGVVGFILLIVIIIMCIRRHRQMMMYRRRKTKFCCCKNPQQNQKGFYKT